MTLKEALTIKASKLSLSDSEIDLALTEAKLIGSSEYNVDEDGKALDMVYVGLLLTTISVSEIKEDDVSIKYSNDLKGIASAIYRKWGLVDPFATVKPTVKQRLIW